MGSGPRRSTISLWRLPRNMEQAISGDSSLPTFRKGLATSAGKLSRLSLDQQHHFTDQQLSSKSQITCTTKISTRTLIS